MNIFECRIVSSLEKVMLNQKTFSEHKKASCFRNEKFSFQIAYRSNEKDKIPFKLSISGDKKPMDLRFVGNVPSELAANKENFDDDYISVESGLYPDVLYPFKSQEPYAIPHLWHSIWIIIDASKYKEAGLKRYEFKLENKEKGISEKLYFELDVIDAFLPKQKLKFTEWIHLDCIADLNNTKVFSEKHWKLIEENVKMAEKCGINMLLVPIFTPPLDTAIGGERKTVQLVGVEKIGKEYHFDFSLFERYIAILKKYNIEYFEISHLFTQWGAISTPKIVVKENGKMKKAFGWHVSSASEEYKDFLNQFIPKLKEEIYKLKIEKNVYFHISDEPNETQLESYKTARNLVYDMLKEFNIIDALSELDFYNKGLIEIPVPCSPHLEKFLPIELKERWTYYCCGEGKEVSNRFFSMPSYRNRILGTQLFKHSIDGFLHWGYNFYYSQFSKRVINPYLTTDADCAFPSGDAFMVYPYKNTVIESLRAVVFHEGLQDLRALWMLADLTSKEETEELMEKALGCEISIKKYPKNPKAILRMREQVNKKIRKILGK